MSKKLFVVDIDLLKNQLLQARVENLASAPASPALGQIYFDTTLSAYRIWNGTRWDTMDNTGDPRPPQAHVLATNAGLGADHTIAGATKDDVLVAESATTARFKQLDHNSLANKGSYNHAAIDTHIDTPSIHRSINDNGSANTDLFSAAKILSLIADINSAVSGGLINKGGYDATTNTPNLDSTPIAGIKNGHTYVVTAAGQFFTENVQVGDMLIAKQDSPTTLAHWTLVNKNIPDIVAASETAQGIVELATNAEASTGTDTTRAVTPAGLKHTLDNRNASETATGLIELATQAEVNAGSDTTRAVTPATLKGLLGTGVGQTAARKFVKVLDTSATSYTITHSLNTQDAVVQIRQTALPFAVVEAEVVMATANTVIINFNSAPTANTYSVTVIG